MSDTVSVSDIYIVMCGYELSTLGYFFTLPMIIVNEGTISNLILYAARFIFDLENTLSFF